MSEITKEGRYPPTARGIFRKMQLNVTKRTDILARDYDLLVETYGVLSRGVRTHSRLQGMTWQVHLSDVLESPEQLTIDPEQTLSMLQAKVGLLKTLFEGARMGQRILKRSDDLLTECEQIMETLETLLTKLRTMISEIFNLSINEMGMSG